VCVEINPCDQVKDDIGRSYGKKIYMKFQLVNVRGERSQGPEAWIEKGR
jgi:hypothetical protein